MRRNNHSFLTWTPRVLGILFILFLMSFSMDSIKPGLSVGQIAIGILVHNIPAILLFIALAISWKHKTVGGGIFILMGLLYIFMLGWPAILSSPAFLIGILFIFSGKKNDTVRKK